MSFLCYTGTVDTRTLCRIVRFHGYPTPGRPRYPATEEALVKLSQRGVLSHPEGGRVRSGRRGAQWSATHVRQAVLYYQLRERRLWGRRLAVRYWWRTGRNASEARAFFRQLIQLFGIVYDSFVRDIKVAGQGLQRLRKPVPEPSLQEAQKAWTDWQQMLTSLVEGLPPSQRTDENKQKLALKILSLSVGLEAIFRDVPDSTKAPILRWGLTLLPLIARYLEPAYIARLLDNTNDETLEAIRVDLRKLTATLLRKQRVRVHVRRNLQPALSGLAHEIASLWGARFRKRVRFDLATTREGAISIAVLVAGLSSRFIHDNWGTEGFQSVRSFVVEVLSGAWKEKQGAVPAPSAETSTPPSGNTAPSLAVADTSPSERGKMATGLDS